MGRRLTVRQQKAAFIAALAAGNTRGGAAAQAGVHRTTPWKWAERSDAFALAVEKAESDFKQGCIDRIKLAARRGSWRADA